MQRQGFVVMTVICAAIIAGSAAWTQQAGFRRMPDPTPDAASAADLWQQSLQNAATPPAPTDAPPLWLSPVSALDAAQGYDAQQLVPSGIAGLWRVHDAVDLAAAEGEPVAAMREGTVAEVSEQPGLGMRAIIDHGDGIVAEYAGLAAAEVQAGQRVRAGETIGAAGHAHGRSAPSCLHLRVTRDGQSIDPMELLDPARSP